jgi:hypothetical protein
MYSTLTKRGINVIRTLSGFLCAALLFPQVLFAADISLIPAQGSFQTGDIFTVDIDVTGNDQAINAVSGALTFPADKLAVKSISKNGSIIKLWAEEPSFSNTTGMVKFEGVILNPGFSDAKGKVLSVTFQAKKEGNVSVIIASGQVLANDGNATNVVRNLNNGDYTVTRAEDTQAAAPSPAASAQPQGEKPVIVSSSYPDQNAWYNSKEARFSWNVPSGVLAVSTLYGENSNSVPNKVYTPPISEKSFSVDGDGTQYMHVQFKTKDGWGDVAHYKFQVDTQAPSKLSASLPEGTVTSSPHPMLLITAEDTTSGLKSVYVSIDGQATTTYEVNASSLYKLADEKTGKHTALVTVADKAGNTASVSVDYSVITIDPPKITDYTKYAEKGDVMKVEGTTYPLSTVQVAYLNVKTNELVVESVQSREDGSFLLLGAKSIPAGVYEMKARVIDRQGAESAYTEPLVVSVENQSLIRIGMFIMNWLSLALIIILALALIAATLWYSLLQFRRFRRGIHRTIREAESALKTNVQALRRDTEEFHTLLAKTQKKRELTKEELAIMKKFKKRLDITEQEIEKKLEQIG